MSADNECPICCEEINSSNNYLMTSCGHTFHHNCFKTAFETCSSTCPMCRQYVDELHVCDNDIFHTIPNTYTRSNQLPEFDSVLDVNFQFTPEYNLFDQFLVSQEWADPTEAYALFMNEDASEMDVEEDSEYVEDANELMDVEEDSEYAELYDLAGRVLALFDDEPVSEENQMMNQPVILV